MGIDLGIDCLATIVDNTDFELVIIKGKAIKSVNQYYNKERAHYYGVLRQGKGRNEGSHHSKRLRGLDRKRFYKIKDYFHKTSFRILEIALKRKVSKIIIGMNKGWKEEVELRKKEKQHFKHLPHSMLMNMLRYKAEKFGIEVIIYEESYTSKASFVDMDKMSTYKKEQVDWCGFQWKTDHPWSISDKRE
jgi:putative transposase